MNVSLCRDLSSTSLSSQQLQKQFILLQRNKHTKTFAHNPHLLYQVVKHTMWVSLTNESTSLTIYELFLLMLIRKTRYQSTYIAQMFINMRYLFHWYKPHVPHQHQGEYFRILLITLGLDLMCRLACVDLVDQNWLDNGDFYRKLLYFL